MTLRFKTVTAVSALVLAGLLLQGAPARAADAADNDAVAARPADNAAAKPADSTDDSGTLKRADSDMKKVLEQLQSLGGKPIENLSAKEARQQPTPADAVKAVLKADGKDPAKEMAKMNVATKDVTWGNGLPARIYMPADADKDGKLPVIVYYHGGGWVIADIDVYDASPRSLAKKAKAIVVAPEYRKGPEHKFPAAHEDAFAAYQWALKNAASWGGDPGQVAVLGESAGGNLAANVAIAARDKGVQMPAGMVLVYPVAQTDMKTESYRKNENAKPLNKAMMKWFVKNELPKDALKDPRIDLVHANLKGLPPATVITAEIDPLMSDGKMLADALKDAGVDTAYKNYDGVTHEFFGMAAVVGDADKAQDYAVDQLKDDFKAAKKAEDKK